MIRVSQNLNDLIVPSLAVSLLLWIFLTLFFSLWPNEAYGALERFGEVKTESVYNPKPLEGDVLLPMPCGLSMAFRLVAIRVKGRLRDMETRFGNDDDNSKPFLDRHHPVYLGSPIGLNDLPPALRQAASPAVKDVSTDQVYLIGKYEVTNAQWQAMSGSACAALDQESAKPKTAVSWYDVLDFSAKYTDWLLKNHPDLLPTITPDNLGVVRLPTEEEWEYAARGGHETPTDWLRSEPFFPLQKEDSKPREYGLFQDNKYPPETKPGNIGRWLPNPLGLFDTAGNVNEMTISSFKMTVPGRLHGSAGGFVSKGGSFMDEYEAVLPGRRQETAFVYAEGPVSANNLGFRLAVSADNTLGQARLSELKSEWEKMGGYSQTVPLANNQKVAALTDSADPLIKIDSLLASAQDEASKEALERLRAEMKDFNVIVARQNEAAVNSNCRSLVYAVYSIYNSETRRKVAAVMLENQKKDIKLLNDALKSADRNTRNQLEDLIPKYKKLLANAQAQLEGFETALDKQFEYYSTLLTNISRYEPKIVDMIMPLIRQDIKGNDHYSQSMRLSFQQVNLDIGKLRAGQEDKITLESIIKNADF
ncbi:MAG: SUMF1/EgtB/PvdO family nonheme iron enzyme [Deltaproteobacteria bacterium]|jgi:hypothetical protein|nr:SUMF1/EgtB/PvdO family nonheme iron enzyme [Deltaproteobacteria bacterium]